MSSTEALRVQLNNVQLKKQWLEVENARRWRMPGCVVEEARSVDAEAEAEGLRGENERILAEHQHMRGLCEQLLVDMQEQQAKASKLESQLQQVRAESQEEIGRLQATLEQQGAALQRERSECEQKLEPECLRSADAERRK
jgi:DNA anti-recombination protein RmuC